MGIAAHLLLLVLTLTGTLGGCQREGTATRTELEVLVTAYHHVYRESYGSWRPSVVADFTPGSRPDLAVSPYLETPFAEAVGVAQVPARERELRCDGVAGESRCTFDGHDLVVTPRSLRVDGDRASLALEFIHPTPCEEASPGGSCARTFVADGYDIELERARGRWRVVAMSRWFT